MLLVQKSGIFPGYEDLSSEGERRWVVDGGVKYISVGKPLGEAWPTLWYIPYDKAVPAVFSFCGECSEQRWMPEGDYICRRCRQSE
jgi:hypothetical protein